MNTLPESGASPADARRWAEQRLVAAGCVDAAGDAALLVADVMNGGVELSEAGRAALAEAVRRRARREPLGYVRGRARFRGLELEVDRRVFVPRPETEPLVDAALAIPRGARVLEPCTGSGAVALALKRERPDLDITATDRSCDALDVARANAARLGLEVTLAHADGVAGAPGGPYDAVVANPPYVAEAEAGAGSLPPEIEHFEPPTAFWAGHDGLSVYRRFASELEGVGWVAFEVGDGQAPAVREMLEGAGFDSFGDRRVASGEVRVVVAERAGVAHAR